MKKKNTILYTISVLAIILIINLISEKIFFRFDFTSDNRYTLSKATKNILNNLDETVTVTAYFSEDLPAEVLRSKQEFKDLLIEYRNAAHGQFEFEFINPSLNEKLEQEASKAGIYPVMINVRERDQIMQQKAFLGAVVESGNKREIIPFVQPGMPIEYTLSAAIRKMTTKKRPFIGFLQGHGEPSPYAMQQVMAEMSVMYNIKTIDLQTDVKSIDSISTLVIIEPIDTIKPTEFAIIDKFMASGGKVFVGIRRTRPNPEQLFVYEHNTGLEQWLLSKNISVDSKLAIDNYCATVNVQQQQGYYRVNVQQQFPYIPFVTNFAGHAITNGLEQVQLQFPSPVAYVGDSASVFTPLLFTSDRSAVLNVPTNIDVQRQWAVRDFPLAEIPLGGVLETNGIANLIVIGDGSFAQNGDPRQPRQQSPDNISLFVNSIDYLSDDTGLISLRTKGITSRPIEQLDDSTRTFIKWLNVLLPILIVVLIGIIRLQQQRNLRIKRMEEGYVE